MTASGLIDEATLTEELRRAIAESSTRVEARWRSWPVVALTLASAALLAVTRWWVGSSWPEVLGELTLVRTWLLLAVVSGALVVATLAYHALGVEHPVYRWAATVDRLCRTGALMTSLVLSGQAALFFMLVGLPRGYAWRAESASERRRTLCVELFAYSVVAGCCVWLGQLASAAVVGLSLSAFGVAYGITARSNTRSMRARVERDLLERAQLGLEVDNLRGLAARELHDGVGADVMALVLQLRAASERDATAGGLAKRAEQVLAGLRSVVWWLRNEEGTVGELGKLIDATCSRLHPGLTYERRPLGGDASLRLGSAVALGTLKAAQELVRLSSERAQVSRVTVALSMGAALELSVEADGLEPADGAAHELEALRCLVEALAGSLEIVKLEASVGLRAKVVLPRRVS